MWHGGPHRDSKGTAQPKSYSKPNGLQMLTFAVVVLLLLPLGTPQLPTSAIKPWTVNHGRIFDANGQDVGVYGVDSPASTLRR